MRLRSGTWMNLLAILVGQWTRRVAALQQQHAPLPPIVIKGYKLFANDTKGAEFVVKGLDYFPRPNAGILNRNSVDLYTDKHQHIWERDIVHLQELGVNAIRLYAVDPTQNHDAFMCAMEAAGIYVVVALAHDCPTCAVTRDEAPDCYPPQLKLQGQAVIRAFSKYRNTLAFSAGNEVNDFAPPGDHAEWNAPCQKRFVQDMRRYLASCPHLRQVPIGLVSADDERDALAQYYNCEEEGQAEAPPAVSDRHKRGGGSNSNNNATTTALVHYETAEWYGLNAYVFCDGQAERFADALGLRLLDASFASYNYSIPVLMTEFGCLSETFPTIGGWKGQRNFLQAQWLLDQGDTLRQHFSGGFAFEYSKEWETSNGYGIGEFLPQGCDDVATACTYHAYPSFYALQRAYQQTIVANVTTLAAFEPDPHRLRAFATCPSKFPLLKDLDWSAVDETPNLKCPRQGQASHFQCRGLPRRKSTLPKQQPPYDGSLSSSSSAAWLRIFMAAVLAIIVLVLVLVIMAVLAQRWMQHGSGHDTSESEGLLSLKGPQSGSDGVRTYSSVDSEP